MTDILAEYRFLIRTYRNLKKRAINSLVIDLFGTLKKIKEINYLFDTMFIYYQYLDFIYNEDVDKKEIEDIMVELNKLINSINKDYMNYTNSKYENNKLYNSAIEQLEQIRLRIIGLSLTNKDIEDYYQDYIDFPIYNCKIFRIESVDNKYGIEETEDGKLIAFVPLVKNLENALMNINIIRKLIEINDSIELRYPMDDPEYIEQIGKSEEEIFLKQYVNSKVEVNKILKKSPLKK